MLNAVLLQNGRSPVGCVFLAKATKVKLHAHVFQADLMAFALYLLPANQGQYDQLATILYAASLGGNKSADQRLSAYGAVTASLKVAYAFTPDTVADVKLETYRQSASMRLGGGGSPSLDPFRARFIQLGITHRF